MFPPKTLAAAKHHLCQDRRLMRVLLAMWLTACAMCAEAASFNPSNSYLTLNSVRIGNTQYDDVVVQLNAVAVISLGTVSSSAGYVDTAVYDPVSRYVAISSLQLGSSYYLNLVARIDSMALIQVGGQFTTTPQTVAARSSVPTPSYTGAALSFFNGLNTLRSAMGLGQLAQNSALDSATANHNAYLIANNTGCGSSLYGQVDPGTNTLYAHSEDAGNPDFTGALPYNRDIAAGYPSSGSVGWEVANCSGYAGQASLNSFVNSVYHRFGVLTDQVRDVGININTANSNVVDMGYSPLPSTVPAGFLAVYPSANATQIPATFYHQYEFPTPLADVSASPIGYPITAQVASSRTLIPIAFTVTPQGGSTLPARVLTAATDPTGEMQNFSAALVPLSPLKLGTSYTVNFTGVDDDGLVQKQWSFNTLAAQIVVGSPLPTLTLGQYSFVPITIPSGNVNLEYSYSPSNANLSLSLQGGDDSGFVIQAQAAAGSCANTCTLNLTATDTYFTSLPGQSFQLTIQGTGASLGAKHAAETRTRSPVRVIQSTRQPLGSVLRSPPRVALPTAP